VLDPGEIQQNLSLSFSSKAANRLVQAYSGAADSFPTLKIDDSHIFDSALIDIKVNHFAFHSKLGRLADRGGVGHPSAGGLIYTYCLHQLGSSYLLQRRTGELKVLYRRRSIDHIR